MRVIQHQSACLSQHVWVGYNDPQVNVHWRHDTALQLELAKLDSLQEASARFGKPALGKPARATEERKLACLDLM